MSGQFDVVDFTVQDHGSVVMFTPQTTEAKEVMNHLELEGWQIFGDGFAVHPRLAIHLIEAFYDEGLLVKHSH